MVTIVIVNSEEEATRLNIQERDNTYISTPYNVGTIKGLRARHVRIYGQPLITFDQYQKIRQNLIISHANQHEVDKLDQATTLGTEVGADGTACSYRPAVMSGSRQEYVYRRAHEAR